jgi:hypothetical protein
MTKLQTVTVGAGGQASVTFSNIPQNYTDLKIVASARSDRADTSDNFIITFNGVTTGYSYKYIQGSGATAYSGNSTTGYVGNLDASTATASTFGSAEFYIPNYTSNTYKSVSSDTVDESNNTNAYATLNEQLWSNPAAITSINFKPQVGSNFVQFSTFYLYGIKNAQKTAGNSIKATGGNIVFDGTYVYHVFPSTGAFVPTQALTVDALVIAGGGSGASGGNSGGAGGGGAGGFLGFANQSFISGTSYVCTVGAGGAAVSQYGGTAANGNTGNDSQLGSLTTVKGGGYGGGGLLDGVGTAGGPGGSGGGAGRWSNSASFNGGTATSGQGNNGGGALSTGAGGRCSGGGGGAGGVGTTTTNVGTANGGIGLNTYSSWATATGTGVSGYYAGGGAGSAIGQGPASGGLGGGGGAPLPLTTPSGATQTATSGTANTGGGGGGMGGGDIDQYKVSGAGGSGIIIVRYRG